jgi:hypothetical protein
MLYITLVKYRQRVVSSLVTPSLSSLPHFAEVYEEREENLRRKIGNARFSLFRALGLTGGREGMSRSDRGECKIFDTSQLAAG